MAAIIRFVQSILQEKMHQAEWNFEQTEQQRPVTDNITGKYHWTNWAVVEQHGSMHLWQKNRG